MTKAMTKTLATGLLGAALGGLLTGARAQTPASDTAVKPLTIKLGVFLPNSGGLKNALGKTWFSTGAEYTFNPPTEGDNFIKNPQQNLLPLVYVDYAGRSEHGLKASAVGVGVGVRYYASDPGAGGFAPYLGAGVGAYFLHASGFGSSSDKTRAGGRVVAGLEFQQRYVLEAAYTGAGKINGVRYDGLTIEAGVRF